MKKIVKNPLRVKADRQIVLTGTYRQSILSSKGELEGLLLEVERTHVQVVIDPAEESEFFDAVFPGMVLQIKAAPGEPSPKGEPVHPVYRFHALQTIDGKKPNENRKAATFKGTVARLNFAKHGVPNGVVLDGGEFIHMRPRGFQDVQLTIGDYVEASGKSRKMVRGGFVLEANTVNGVGID